MIFQLSCVESGEPGGGVALEGGAHELRAGADAGLHEELLDAGFDGGLGDFEARSDLLVGEAVENGAEYEALAFGQGAGFDCLWRCGQSFSWPPGLRRRRQRGLRRGDLAFRFA